ncbi:NrdA ribonucleotide reductase A subunit [Synechococcus phage metaG-MbCM1]|uniref:NrdA ribonucleotide reductase A subunit n=1 Tax=Synechococcus phage metaG-MbCM1 TaxID=1079999 RepID=H8ZNI0_9CAUD|nr:NrdA ribonucleotide reductase A subunit [Synechococcus phage metaG-MbCM1]AFD03041.1 NrdA ribonucleotide reductase A subunit [Synechococcus phage metaG-MbCM1]
MLMTPSILSLAVTWRLVNMLHNVRVSASTQAESVGSTVKSVAEKFNTQVLYHSSFSLFALSDGALKMAFGGGSATVHFPIWHQEIEDIIVLKNNKGTEDNRVRKLDYSIQLSKLFYERFIQNAEISLFSPHDVPGLYDAFGTDAFDACYVDYESD